jgi:predicted kinase
LIVVSGLSGTGKSTLATALSEALGATLLRTDVVRRELFGDSGHDVNVDVGIYSPASRDLVYEEFCRRAAELQRSGLSVVLDGTFSTNSAIEMAQHRSTDANAFLAIECVCRPEVACGRLLNRQRRGDDASAARVETYHMQRLRWEPRRANIPQSRIDTEQNLNSQCAEAISAIAQHVRLKVDTMTMA